ncbi:MAG: alkaline phosphatase family protein [Clostridiaceae bacterium]|jgi:predicted AlkP superfamily pyrophosphatase or phosphodiesterase|nr:alkaline phosphatase family protein [Clostridiaceae bacterium]
MKNKMKRMAIFVALILIFGVALPIMLTACQETMEESPADYKRVVVVGVDGMGAFAQEVPTPNMDRIFANGATTYTMQSTVPSVSGPSWGSMFYGVDPEVHGWNNDDMYANAWFTYFNSINGNYFAKKHEPEGIYSLFKLVSDAYPGAEQAAICYFFAIWAYIEYGVNVYLDGYMLNDYGMISDAVIAGQVLKYLDAGNDPKFMYVHFDNVDHFGHSDGSASDIYRQTITEEDGYIGQIYDKYEELGWLEDTLFIVTTDHGHTPEGGHGGLSPEEMNSFLGVAGKTVKNGQIGDANMKDVAAVIAHALKIKAPDFWTNKLPEGIF